jgi:hypothetical protein
MFGNCALTFSQILWNVLHNKHPLYTPPIPPRIPPERYTPAEMYREYVNDVHTHSPSPSGCWGPIHTHSHSPSAGGMWTGTTSWLGTGGSYGSSGRAGTSGSSGTSGQPGMPRPMIFLDLDSQQILKWDNDGYVAATVMDIMELHGSGYLPTFSVSKMRWQKKIPQPPIPDDLFKLEDI